MRAATILIPLALLAACKFKQEPGTEPSTLASATSSASNSTSAPAPAASTALQPATFDPATVPESPAALPPFPMFKPLDGLENVMRAPQSNVNFDVENFVARGVPVAVEGKVFRGMYPLTGSHAYSALEFVRNYEMAITQLGGIKLTSQLDTWGLGKRLARPVAQQTCIDVSGTCDFYLIRQGGKEWWITVGTGAVPLHGYVTVLEKQGMAKSFAFLDASALKSALDTNGRVPVYVEFDVDRASLRPSARPAVDEIVKLLQTNPQLRVSIEGHTDDTGKIARNVPLSLARAATVQAELIAAGIAPARLKTAGFGATRPLVQGTGEDARARNRRVELVKF